MKSFTRKRKMSFADMTLFMMNMVSKTMQREINDFMKNVKKRSDSYDKSSISKSRLNISPALFIDLNQGLIEDVYEDKEEVKLFQDLRLLAVDGTNIDLPNMTIPKDKKQTEDIKKIYGQHSNQKGKLGATSRTSILYDVENNLILDGILGSIYSSERFMAIEHINALIEHNKNIETEYKDLIIYDRGYPSIGLMAYHLKHNLDFLMRVKSNSFKLLETFKRSKKTDEIIEIKFNSSILKNLEKEKQHPDLKKLKADFKVGDSIKVRAIKVVLKSGKTEILLTSLLSQEEYKTEIFKELYFKRWRIEIAYDIIKNIFDIENFTGLTQIAINQDFFAIILTNNITALVMNSVMEEKVKIFNEEKERKYLYQLNKNFSIGCMKDRLVSMLFSYVRIEKMYSIIEDEIIKNLVPIKPDRNFPRNRLNNTSFPISKKDGF